MTNFLTKHKKPQIKPYKEQINKILIPFYRHYFIIRKYNKFVQLISEFNTVPDLRIGNKE